MDVAVAGGVVTLGVVGVVGMAVEGCVVSEGVHVMVTTENRGGGVSNTLYIQCI